MQKEIKLNLLKAWKKKWIKYKTDLKSEILQIIIWKCDKRFKIIIMNSEEILKCPDNQTLFSNIFWESIKPTQSLSWVL